MEQWKCLDFIGKPNYYVSNEGRIKGPNGIRKLQIGGKGYLQVSIFINGKMTQQSVHRLVAIAFVPNPKPELYNLVNHKDGNKQNNFAWNLEWSDYIENGLHSAHILGNRPDTQGEKHFNHKVTEQDIIWIRTNFKPYDSTFGRAAMCLKFNLSYAGLNNILNGKTWRHVDPPKAIYYEK